MKKLIALALCLSLLLCLLSGCGGGSSLETYDADEAAAGETTTEETGDTGDTTDTVTTSIGAGGDGFAAYDADTVVATVNGEDVTWMEYYYWLFYYLQYVQSVASQYGATLTAWDANELSSSQTNAEVVISNAQRNVILDHAIQTKAGEMSLALDEDDEAELLSLYETNADSICGDGDGVMTEDESAAFDVYLTENNVDRTFFDFLNATDILQDKAFIAEYGESGADYADEDVLAYAEDQGYMAAKHILLTTVDTSTMEALDDDTIAEKLATAEDLLAQLQAVEDDKVALVDLFDELMAEYTEDTGYASYPDGYVFTEGEMVTEFEDAVKALEGDYALSDIVESSYGYHIILSIPIDPDIVIGTTSSGSDVTLRYQAAASAFSSELSTWTEEAEVTWADGFDAPDMEALFG